MKYINWVDCCLLLLFLLNCFFLNASNDTFPVLLKIHILAGHSVAHAYNPSYSGVRDHSLKPASQIVHETLSWKNSSQKRTGGVVQGVGPGFKPQNQKKKKNSHSLCWRCGSSGRALPPAEHAPGHEFKPQYCQKKPSIFALAGKDLIPLPPN
jgi:hypothetical protein